jgi:MerR family transcriptional regulator, heat shock protein HspR
VSTRRVRTSTRIELTDDRGVFMISVAAELAEMHPQTLRMYEQRGLIAPKRSPKGTRLYSQADVERLKRIQEMTAELGMNLAGVERVFELEEQLEAMSAKLQRLERRARELQAEVERLEELRRSLRAEIVPYVRGGAIVPVNQFPPTHPQATPPTRAQATPPTRAQAAEPRFRIPVERPGGTS